MRADRPDGHTVHVEKSIPNRVTLDESFDVGSDTCAPVDDDCEMPYRFTGKLSGVTINLD